MLYSPNQSFCALFIQFSLSFLVYLYLCLVDSHFGFPSDSTGYGSAIYTLCLVILGTSCIKWLHQRGEWLPQSHSQNADTWATTFDSVPRFSKNQPIRAVWHDGARPIFVSSISTKLDSTPLVDRRQQVMEMKVLQQAHSVHKPHVIFEIALSKDHLKVPLIMPLHAGQQQLGNATCFGTRA